MESVWNETRVDVVKKNLNFVEDFLQGTKKAISAKDYYRAKVHLTRAEEFILVDLNPTGLPKELIQTYDSLKAEIRELKIQLEKESSQ